MISAVDGADVRVIVCKRHLDDWVAVATVGEVDELFAGPAAAWRTVGIGD